MWKDHMKGRRKEKLYNFKSHISLTYLQAAKIFIDSHNPLIVNSKNQKQSQTDITISNSEI